MTTTVKQIVKEVLDEMDGQTFSEHKQFRDVLEGKLTNRLKEYVHAEKGEAARKAVQEILDSVKETPCAKCGMIKN